MAWLKLDEHLPDNRKVQALPGELFKFWINLLCVAKPRNGHVDVDDAVFRLRMPKTRVCKNIAVLVGKGLIEYPCEIHDWDSWQYQDGGRGRRFRERHATLDGNAPETTVKQNGNVSETVDETDLKHKPSDLFCSDSALGLKAEEKTNPQRAREVSTLDPPFGTLESLEDWFAIFWEKYWLHKAKAATLKAFRRHVTTRDKFNRIIEARDKQLPEMLSKAPQYRPQGATWLNGERWNDETINGTEPTTQKGKSWDRALPTDS